MAESRKSGRGWAYVGVLLGGAVSVAANVAHAYVPPTGAPAGWHPQTGAVLGAVVWPAALFTAIEIMARTAWPTGARWVIVRFAGLLPVALVAAVVSYGHLSALLATYRETWLTSHIGPLAVDGLMVMASAALMATSPARTAQSATVAAVHPAPVPVSTPTPAAPVATPAAPAEPVWTAEPFAEPEPVNAPAVNEGTDSPEPVRLDTERAAAIIRQGWSAGRSVTETAADATRSKAYVSQVFAKLDKANGHALTGANGHAVSPGAV